MKKKQQNYFALSQKQVVFFDGLFFAQTKENIQ